MFYSNLGGCILSNHVAQSRSSNKFSFNNRYSPFQVLALERVSSSFSLFQLPALHLASEEVFLCNPFFLHQHILYEEGRHESIARRSHRSSVLTPSLVRLGDEINISSQVEEVLTAHFNHSMGLVALTLNPQNWGNSLVV